MAMLRLASLVQADLTGQELLHNLPLDDWVSAMSCHGPASWPSQHGQT